MKPAIIAFVLMVSTFLTNFCHRSLPDWKISESLPWSTERSAPTGPLFEIALAFFILFALWCLIQLPNWKKQAPQVTTPQLPRARVRAGALKCALFFLTIWLSAWAGSHMDIGWDFRLMVSDTFGLPSQLIPNAAAMFTLVIWLVAIVIICATIFASRREPAVVQNQPAPAINPLAQQQQHRPAALLAQQQRIPPFPPHRPTP